MIIKRKYATYGQLNEDKESRAAIEYALRVCGGTKDTVNETLFYARNLLVCNTDEETIFPKKAFHMFMEKLEELDKTNPYDNGLTYRDVTGSIFFPSRKGNALMQVLVSDRQNLYRQIVQVVAFEHDGDNIKPVTPWDIPQFTL